MTVSADEGYFETLLKLSDIASNMVPTMRRQHIAHVPNRRSNRRNYSVRCSKRRTRSNIADAGFSAFVNTGKTPRTRKRIISSILEKSDNQLDEDELIIKSRYEKYIMFMAKSLDKIYV